MKKQNLTGYIQYYKKNGGTDTKAMGQTEKSFRQLCVIFTKKKCCTTLHPQKFGCTPNNEGKRVRSHSEYYTSMSVSGLPTFLISVKIMNLLSSSIYKHLKTYLIKHKQSLILGECGSQLISVLSNIFQF
jgi:hypothetical protein